MHACGGQLTYVPLFQPLARQLKYMYSTLLALSLLPRMLPPHHFLCMVIDGLPYLCWKTSPMLENLFTVKSLYRTYHMKSPNKYLLVVVILTYVYMTCGIGVPFSRRI